MIGNIAAGLFGVGVTPSTSSYESIATVLVGSGGQSTIDFTSIPSTYKHLQLRTMALNNAGWYRFVIKLNNQSIGSTYNDHILGGNGSGAFADYEASTSKMGGSNQTNPAVSVIDILDYSATNKNKTLRGLYGFDNNGAGQIQFASILWQSTNAINQITITDENGNSFSQNSHFALYGIKD
jgi:hypothetical protein